MVRERRFSAYLTPFATEADALSALEAAGGIVDLIGSAPVQPGRQHNGRR
jgi:hypothetical protein